MSSLDLKYSDLRVSIVLCVGSEAGPVGKVVFCLTNGSLLRGIRHSSCANTVYSFTSTVVYDPSEVIASRKYIPFSRI